MANNPLYPGYINKKEGDPGNPIFPGFYSGKPITKRPNPTPLPEYGYDFADYMSALNQMGVDVANAPKWVVDRYIDDFKQNLKAAYNPQNIPLEQLDDYDPDVLPGVAAVSLSLNPDDWKDPKKQAEKTAKTWIKSATGIKFQKEGWKIEGIDFSDYDTRIKQGIWRRALGMEEDISMASGVSLAAAKALADNTEVMSEGRHGKGSGTGVLDLWNATDTVNTQRYSYRETAKSAIEFVSNIEGGPKRDNKHDEFLTSYTTAVKQEIDNRIFNPLLAELKAKGEKNAGGDDLKFEDLLNPTNTNQEAIIKGYLAGMEAKGLKDADQVYRAAQAFKIKQEMATGVKVLTDRVHHPGFGLTTEISKYAAGDRVTKKILLKHNVALAADAAHPAPYTNSFTPINDKIFGLGGSLGAPAAKGLVSDYKARIGELDKNLERLKRLGHGEAVERTVRDYQKYLENGKKILETFDEKRFKKDGLYRREFLNKLSNLNGNGKNIAGGTVFENSIARELLRDVEMDLILPGVSRGKRSSIKTQDQLGAHLGSLEQYVNGLKLVDPETGKAVSFTALKATRVAYRLEQERSAWAIGEVVDSITQGRFMERYVWNKISVKLTGFTPAELVQQKLKRVGTFGLIIDDDNLAEVFQKNRLFNAVFSNRFKMQLDGKNLTFRGGDSFRAVTTLWGFMDESIPKGLSVKGLQRNDVIDLLTGKKTIFDAGVNKGINWRKGSNYELSKIQNEIDAFKQWLRDNAAKLGIDPKNLEADGERIFKIYHELGSLHHNPKKLTVNITKRYMGVMDRVGMAATKIQMLITENKLFKATVGKVLSAKNWLAEAAAKAVGQFLNKIIIAAAGGATGGIGALLLLLTERLVKPLVRWATHGTINFLKNTVVGFLKGDWNAAFRQLNKSLYALLKFMMYVIGIPTLLLVTLTTGLMGTVLTTISPSDPARENSGYVNTAGVGFPEGENHVVKVTKDAIVTTTNGTVTNPTSSFENDLLASGISVRYVITITAKVDVPGANVAFTDTVTRINSDGTRQLYTTTHQFTESYVANRTYTYEIPSISIPSDSQDSLIRNVVSVGTPAVGTFLAGNVSYTRYFRIGNVASADCFEIRGFSGAEQGVLENALTNIGLKTGGFLSRLCEHSTPESPIILERISDTGTCGYANGKHVTFGNMCLSYYSSVNKMSYIAAHELGHVYHNTVYTNFSQNISSFPSGFAGVRSEDNGMTLPTYDNNCGTTNSISEDFAETIGDFVQVNVYGGCYASGVPDSFSAGDYDLFWEFFPAHRRFAEEVFSAP